MNDLQLDNIALSKHFLDKNPLLKPMERLVLLGIFKHRNNCTFLCFPSVDSIAENTSLNKRTVRRIIDVLIERGVLIRVQHKYGERVNRTYYFSPHDFQHAREIACDGESVFSKAGDFDLLEEAGNIYDDLPPF